MEVTAPLRIGAAAAAVGLALAITSLRFCGAVSLPSKPEPPSESLATSQDVLRAASETEGSWLGYIDRDAATAGVAAPSATAMAKKLVYRSDEGHHSLAPGEPALEVAGLRLTAIASRGTLSLRVENRTERDVAYHVVTRPSPASACTRRDLLPHNAQVIAKGGREERSECEYHDGMSLEIDRIESIELAPLQAYYVSRVPPIALGSEPRLARGHEPELPAGQAICNLTPSQAQRAAIENGAVTWRDLVDFYARHRCDTYRFPTYYRAFMKDGEMPLPAGDR